MAKRLTFVYAELHTLSSQTKTTPANINCSYENGFSWDFSAVVRQPENWRVHESSLKTRLWFQIF